ncbi:putative signal peptide protein [Puccinia sorghi]|uniref:Putative signal peptide protein n=1 Tax=Puccinia sorghi TaxID=27349 RepID=A0A0L6VKJ5_9BASI|nr:putative signal peptide protein [Puccinia sorghi]
MCFTLACKLLLFLITGGIKFPRALNPSLQHTINMYEHYTCFIATWLRLMVPMKTPENLPNSSGVLQAVLQALLRPSTIFNNFCLFGFPPESTILQNSQPADVLFPELYLEQSCDTENIDIGCSFIVKTPIQVTGRIQHEIWISLPLNYEKSYKRFKYLNPFYLFAFESLLFISICLFKEINFMRHTQLWDECEENKSKHKKDKKKIENDNYYFWLLSCRPCCWPIVLFPLARYTTSFGWVCGGLIRITTQTLLLSVASWGLLFEDPASIQLVRSWLMGRRRVPPDHFPKSEENYPRSVSGRVFQIDRKSSNSLSHICQTTFPFPLSILISYLITLFH